jgi:hypothetical protein
MPDDAADVPAIQYPAGRNAAAGAIPPRASGVEINPDSSQPICGHTHDKPIYGCLDIRFHITRFPSRQVSYIVFREPGGRVITCDKSPALHLLPGPNAPGHGETRWRNAE